MSVHDDPIATPPAHLSQSITLETYRTLLGLPNTRDALPSHPPPRWWPATLRSNTRSDPEANIGIYPTIQHQESLTHFHYILYRTLRYGGLITQLLLSALLILLASVPANHHVAIAVFGALNGVITGVLALVGGQGLGTRLVRYKDGLRALREKIEWLERELEAGMREVRYKEVIGLREAYEELRGDEVVSRPGFWVGLRRRVD